MIVDNPDALKTDIPQIGDAFDTLIGLKLVLQFLEKFLEVSGKFFLYLKTKSLIFGI